MSGHCTRACIHKWLIRHRFEKMPAPARKVGKLILVGDLESSHPERGTAVIYARVSSPDQKSDLDRQVARVLT
ncbi:MAG: recombinase family protein [Acidimicrobiaceae bacterium]|nr:recombinase family protein [Acidimicrobiaceae bacterium]